MSRHPRVAVITGASRGIGRSVARLLARERMAVVCCARDPRPLEEVAAEIRAAGGEAFAQACDVADEAQVERMFEAAADRYGGIDVLVNCAGVFETAPFEELSTAQWDHVINVNLRGLFFCCRSAFPHMRRTGGGSIVNISSLAGVKGVEKFPGTAAYVASKFGVAGLTEILAVEGRPVGIRVNAISPGAVDTEMLRGTLPQLKPMITPDDLARLVLYLVSDAGGLLTGSNIEVFSNG
ncbi:MAG: SDR family NAD(P)-dependent oxidoreductase [Pyrinomonadaceae bacterium]